MTGKIIPFVCLAIAFNLQQPFEVFGSQHVGQNLEVREHWRTMAHPEAIVEFGEFYATSGRRNDDEGCC